jgi:hypothetical protein
VFARPRGLLHFASAFLLARRDDQHCVSDIDFRLDLATLGSFDGIAQFRLQFLDLDFERIGHLVSLTFVRD